MKNQPALCKRWDTLGTLGIYQLDIYEPFGVSKSIKEVCLLFQDFFSRFLLPVFKCLLRVQLILQVQHKKQAMLLKYLMALLLVT